VTEFWNSLLKLEPAALVLVGAGLLILVALALGIRAVLVSRRTNVLDRLQKFQAGADGPSGDNAQGVLVEQEEGGLLKALSPFSKLAKPGDTEGQNKIRGFLSSAGFRSDKAVEYYLGAKVVGAVIGLIGFILVAPSLDASWDTATAVALVMVAIGFYFPALYVSSRRSERQKAITQALPDTLDLLVTAVEAGLAIDSALKRVGEEMQLAAPLLSEEFRLTALEMTGGLSRGESFRRLAARTEVTDLKTLAAVLVQAEMFGTSVAKSLRIQSDSLRVKRSQRAEEQAAKVAVKLTVPLITLVLPSLMTILLGTAVIRFLNIFFPAAQ
jgi:tight adherence protein C